MKAVTFVVFLASVLLPRTAVAQTSSVDTSSEYGTFSSLRYIEEAGDVLGAEITIVPQFETAYAIFQCAEGVPAAPVFVPLTVRGNHVSFDVNAGAFCDGHYVGEVSAKGMQLTNTREPRTTEFLPRKKSYWAK
jgi:hypothetical protein